MGYTHGHIIVLYIYCNDKYEYNYDYFTRRSGRRARGRWILIERRGRRSKADCHGGHSRLSAPPSPALVLHNRFRISQRASE